MRWAGPSGPRVPAWHVCRHCRWKNGQERPRPWTLKKPSGVSHTAGACLTVEKESWGDPSPSCTQLRQQELAASPGQALTPFMVTAVCTLGRHGIHAGRHARSQFTPSFFLRMAFSAYTRAHSTFFC